ncbi:MAG: hypothetical protein QM771_18590 [Nitrospira sp.]
MQPKAPLPSGDATLKSGNAEQVKRISSHILAAADVHQILLDLRHEILGCFDAEDLTLFVVDSEKKEIFSKIRISIPFTKYVRRSPSKAWRGFAPNTCARSMSAMPTA